MSAATRATTARERASIAADFIRRGSTSGREFSDCFEMFDGDEVVALLVEKAATDPRIAVYASSAGWMPERAP